MAFKNIFKKMTAQRKAIRKGISVKKKNTTAINKAYSPATTAKVTKTKKAQSIVGGYVNKPVAPAKASSTWKSKAPASTYRDYKYTQAEKYEMIKKRRKLGPHD